MLHFVGSLPFANMITNTTDMSTYDLNVRTGPKSSLVSTYDSTEQGGMPIASHSNIVPETATLSDTDCQTDSEWRALQNAENVPENVLSLEDALVRKENSQLVLKRREDELREQLAGAVSQLLCAPHRTDVSLLLCWC